YLLSSPKHYLEKSFAIFKNALELSSKCIKGSVGIKAFTRTTSRVSSTHNSGATEGPREDVEQHPM
ncbi:hypothetical protein SGI37_20450, partial [Providencia rettgeri]